MNDPKEPLTSNEERELDKMVSADLEDYQIQKQGEPEPFTC
jgi:hypothetical protein